MLATLLLARALARNLLLWVLAVMLVSCGGGGDGSGRSTEPVFQSAREEAENVAPLVLDVATAYQFQVRSLRENSSSAWSEYLDYNVSLYSDFPSYDEGEAPTIDLGESSRWLEWSMDRSALGYEVRATDAVSGSVLGEEIFPAVDICTDGICRLEPKVQIADESNVFPEAITDQLVVEGFVPLSVTLDAGLSNDSDGKIVSYRWSVKGRFPTLPDKPMFQYKFEQPGTYQIMLDVTDNEGARSRAYIPVTVSLPPSDSGVEISNLNTNEVPEVSSAGELVPPSLYLTVAIVESRPDKVVQSITSVTTDTAKPVGSSNLAPEATDQSVQVSETATRVPDIASAQSAQASKSAVSEELEEARTPIEQEVESSVVSNTNPASGPVVSDVEATDVEATRAVVRWEVSKLATGQVEFGETTDYGQWTKLESSFDWDHHIQRVSDLQPSTTYHFRVHSVDSDGNATVSEDDTFTTEALPEPAAALPGASTELPVAEDWPANANGELPLAGIFYGNHIAGVATANASIAIESSRRFRAERSGFLSFVRYNNRVLTDVNIQYRCDSYGKGSIWCNCVDAGLDAYTCGYTLGNSYSVGNGGTILVELRPDNGSGEPSDTVIGKTAPFIPQDNANLWYPALEFTSPTPIQAGTIYHLVFTNLNPPSHCSLAGVAVSQAGSCPRNQGAMGLNGVYHISDPTTTGKFGPMRGDAAAANLYRRTANSEWDVYDWSLSFFELGYDDGVAIGESYHAFDAVRDGRQTIQGATHGRQKFLVKDASRAVDGMWLNFGHTSTADGSSLNVALKDSGGVVLATGSIAPSDHCKIKVKNTSDYVDANCKDWGYTSFGKTVDLLEGSTYTLELSAGYGAGFHIPTYQTLYYHGFTDRNHWNDARAELSYNSGSTWGEWSSAMPEERDMALLFTIEGMPRQLK